MDKAGQRALKIAGIYALCGFLWIALSDRMLAEVVRDSELITRFQTFKGWAFIVVTGLLVFLLSRRALREPERLAAEAQASEARFRALFENVNVVALVIDTPSGDIVDANEAAASFYGWSRQQLRTMNISAINTLSRDEIRARMSEVASRKRGFFLFKHRRADGSERDVEVYSGPLPYQGRAALYSIIHDVTERTRTERALLEEKLFFESLFHNIPGPAYVFGEDGRFTRWNRYFERVLGFPPEQMAGMTALDAVAPVDRENVARQIERVFREGYSTVELHILTSDGRTIPHFCMGALQEVDGKRYVIGVGIDITEKKRAEEALAKSERMLQTIFDAEPECVKLLDENANLIMMNRAGLDMLEVGSLDQVKGQCVCPMVTSEHRQPFLDLTKRVFQGESGTLVFEMVGMKGRRLWMETHAVPLRNEKNEITALLGVTRDITERMRAEAETRRNEARMSSLYRISQHPAENEQSFLDLALNEAISLTGSAIGYLYSYDEMKREFTLNAYSRDVMKECSVAEKKTCYELDRTGIWGEAVRQRKPILLNDFGSGHPLKKGYPEGHAVLRKFLTVPVIMGGAVVAVVGVANKPVDYTDADVLQLDLLMDSVWKMVQRARAEDALRQSEERLDLALQSAHMGVWRWEIKENRRYFDDLTCQLLGIDRTTFAGAAEEFFRAVHPEDREKVKAALARTLAQDIPYEPSYRVVWIDGTVRYITARGRLIRDDQGQPERINGILWDITDQHLFEQELLKTQKLESIGTLAGGIAHDFNNLLQGIFGYISMAKMKLDQREKALAMLEQAEMALHQSVSLASQLLTFSKGGKPVKKLLSLRPVIERACTFSLSGSRTDCRLTIDDSLWHVEADEGQVGQVVQNIVLNADQAMPGGGTIGLTASNVPAGDAALPQGLEPGNYVSLSISDSGIGIPAEYVSKIFDPYFTTKERGSGLGLATSYSIIRNHGGMITVRSAPGAGTTFTVYLPASPDRVAKVQDRASPAPGRTGRVLVMDDDDVVRTVAGELLLSLGHEVELAVHGGEAIEKYRQAMAAGRPFDVVILDLTIRGGMGGAETVKKLLELDPAVKAVVSSGYSDDAVTSNYREHGFRSYLSKPYTVAGLNDLLSKLMS